MPSSRVLLARIAVIALHAVAAVFAAPMLGQNHALAGSGPGLVELLAPAQQTPVPRHMPPAYGSSAGYRVGWSPRLDDFPADQVVADEETEYERLIAKLRGSAEGFARKNGRIATDSDLEALEKPTMARLAELAGMKGRWYTVRGPCPSLCQGQGTCNYRTSTCVCDKCFRGHDCGVCRKPCSDACSANGTR